MPSDPRAPGKTVEPAGTQGDGMAPYPTYHDSPAASRNIGTTKPTDAGLPRAQRTYALPILIGLIVFAAVIIVRLVWGSFNLAETTDEALAPGDPASPPAAAAPASPTIEQPAATTAPAASPGEVAPEPGPIDVPGGDTTTPVQPDPAQ